MFFKFANICIVIISFVFAIEAEEHYDFQNDDFLPGNLFDKLPMIFCRHERYVRSEMCIRTQAEIATSCQPGHRRDPAGLCRRIIY
ncbi:Hypothetical protein NTJ_02389 [Nesidiocoris tenuis]|uniref:Uncharacterized protein n=1 Tax=Nesidiocoris tenuis TaxID=355587 RepID=A0ABN7AEA4_9HEMI|nr:Hypothetical protein NTJ_02389 [Nesidiocoris tenuis]